MENVKGFLISKGLLQGDPSAASRPIRQLHTERVSSLYPSVFFSSFNLGSGCRVLNLSLSLTHTHKHICIGFTLKSFTEITIFIKNCISFNIVRFFIVYKLLVCFVSYYTVILKLSFI